MFMKRTGLAFLIALFPTVVFAQATNLAGPIWYTTNFVGINDSNPQVRLSVKGANGSEGINFTNTNTLGVAYIAFGETGGLSTPSYILRQGSASATNPRSMEIWVAENGLMRFGTNNAERIRITATGFVGIGTTAPTAMLDVAGDINVSGNIAAKYQDIAEWVPSDGDLTSGTVVILDTDESNRVEPSRAAYDTKVAGVVSDKPGMLLGEGGADKSKVATTGRVRVKVDATKHPVKIGDLLVTSDVPGYAMLSVPVQVSGISMHRPGTIIGKALEPLAGGRGEILVLLSLQ
jgi:hypothetical protein